MSGEHILAILHCTSSVEDGIQLAENITWSLNTISKKAQQHVYFLRRLRKAHLPPHILTMFYTRTIERVLSSCITAWFGNCTVLYCKTLQQIVRTAEKIIGVSLPSVGCELEEKERFWSELDEVMESIPTGERVVIGADFNGHVGEGNTGDEEVMGKFGIKERNLEGQMTCLSYYWVTGNLEPIPGDYGHKAGKSTTDAIFEKAYDRVPREELWYCMRKSGGAEKYVRVVQDMYERSRTVVRCAVGQTEEFKVEVGLHQGLALSPFLFLMVMEQLSEEVRQASPCTMMFADDIVICSESREQVEENLERWREEE
ncbi:hypothetical protein QTP86_001600 [Hemibagrus guttatus]|nr:hypothetical protein QTP86_001600 [Hemibagrus guttatus]